MSTAAFFRALTRSPGHVGAIVPSSSQLAQSLVSWIDWSDVSAVAEYGPGVGVTTEAILRHKADDAHFYAIERDAELAATAGARCPQAEIINGCVSQVARYNSERGIETLDAVISSLPWASFPPALQKELLDATLSVLRPGAYFSTFAYWQGLALPAGQRFRSTLHQRFSEVKISKTIWANFPPAFIYQCRV